MTELAAGYVVIEGFLATLDSTWLPGFLRSYERRSAEYEKALEKYEERGLFLRTLFRKPKRPNRPPANYRSETAERMRRAWRESFATAEPADSSDYALLSRVFNDDFLALSDLRLRESLTAGLVAVGPPGIIVVGDDEGLVAETAVAMDELLAGTALEGTPVHAVAQGALMEESVAEKVLDGQDVFVLADVLLARGQAAGSGRTFSARVTAEKLAQQEKDNLLRMAATL